MLDLLIIGGAIIVGLGFIARVILEWKKLDDLDKKEEEDHK